MKKMRVLPFLVFLLTYFHAAEPSQIILGIKSEYLKVWRFWEQENNKSKLRLFIYNPQDKPISLSLHRKEFETIGTSFKEKKKLKKLSGPWKIQPHSYIIRDFPRIKKKKDYQFVQFTIGKNIFAGLLDFIETEPSDLGFEKYSLISTEGLNGRHLNFQIEYDKLIYSSQDTVRLKLYFNRERHIYGSYAPGQFRLKLSFKESDIEITNIRFNGDKKLMRNNEDGIELTIPFERNKGASPKYVLEIPCKSRIASDVLSFKHIRAHISEFEYSKWTEPPGQLKKVMEGSPQIPVLFQRL